MSHRPSDHAIRRQALNPRGSYLVQAPAGSGKTELLTDRILALLPTVQRPEEIVAITFTRKAAAEMHARVMEKLAAGRGPKPEADHARDSWHLARAALAHDERQSWQLLQFPARLAIQTIDAFCASLTRRMPFLSQLGGPARIATEPAELYRQAARETLELADDPDYGLPVRELLRHLDVNPEVATALISAMLASRDQWLPFLGRGADRETLEADLYAAVAHEMAVLAHAMPGGWQDQLPALARAACEVLTTGPSNPLAALAEWADGAALPAEPEALPQWRALAALLLTQSGSPRKALNKNQGFPPGCAHKQPMLDWLEAAATDGRWASGLALCATLPDPRYTEVQWQAMTALFGCLTLAAAQLQWVFGQTGEIDFIEVTQRALQALGESDDPSELLLRMDARIRHLLIDEFQDTSQPQIDLLEKLTAGWQADDGRTLFLVGDPMQSIYRFRKADVGLFLRAAAGGIGQVALQPLALTDNFRSQAGIVDWVNAKFSRLFPAADDAEQSAIAYSPSQAFKPPMPGPAVNFHPVWCADETTTALVTSAHDGQVMCRNAQEVVLQLVRDALADNDHNENTHDVAILVRARSHARALTRLLAEAGIAHRAVELTGLAQRPVVADLTQLARALAHPADRLAWLCVLRAPWCGLRLETLTTLAGQDLTTPMPQLLPQRATLVTDAEERDRLAHVLPILLDDSNASGTLSYATWVEHVWRRLGGPLTYPSARDQADAESFFLLLEEISPYAPPDPAALNAALARLYASADPSPQGRNVQIMTMHKSKGLQFDTVILPGLHLRGRPDSAPLLRFEHTGGRLLVGPIKPQADSDADPISQFLGQRDARRAGYELDRLLYVAATRAKRQLHLVGEIQVDAGKLRQPASSSLLGRLWPQLQGDLPEPVWPAGDGAAAKAPRQAPPALQRLPVHVIRSVAAEAAPFLPGEPPAPTTAAPSASRPGVLFPNNPTHELERITGQLAHAWLEHLAHIGMQAWDARGDAMLATLQTQLSRLGVAGAELDDAALSVQDTLDRTLASERGRWLLSHTSARREWRLLDAHGRQLIIDLALDTGSGWLIVDYKTGLPHPGESATAFEARMLARYEQQLRDYCAALRAVTQTEVRAALYFPRSDHWFEFRDESEPLQG